MEQLLWVGWIVGCGAMMFMMMKMMSGRGSGQVATPPARDDDPVDAHARRD